MGNQAVLVGPAAVGAPAIFGVSLDVDSLLLSADPALSKNCCTLLVHTQELNKHSTL